MRITLVVLTTLAAAAPAWAEDFATERHLCDAHLKVPGTHSLQAVVSGASKYTDDFAAACDAFDVRSAAADAAVRAAKDAADLSALRSAAP